MRRLALTTLLLLLGATALLAPSAAQSSGNPIQQGTVRVNVATPLFFLGPGPGCLFRAYYGLSSPDGQAVGQGQNCIRDDNGAGTLAIDVTLHLAGGTIQASITNVKTYDFDPEPSALSRAPHRTGALAHGLADIWLPKPDRGHGAGAR